MIKFSIIIPLYNKQNFITRAVNSVLSQSYINFELIIVNDGSTDNSLQVVSQIEDKRLRIINKENGGVSSARNQGIDAAHYDWLCFLDADDYWLPNHLQEITFLLHKYPKAKIYSTLIQERTEKKIKIIPNSLPENFEGYVDHYFQYAKKATVFNSSSVCIDKKALIEVGMFDSQLTHGEDLDVWFKLLIRYRGVIKTIPTVVYDLISENRAMHSFCSLEKHLLSKINIYRNEAIYGLNEYIDFFILRNSVPYYFSDYRNNVIPIISTVKKRKNISGLWKYIYMDTLYLINLICYRLYKRVRAIV